MGQDGAYLFDPSRELDAVRRAGCGLWPEDRKALEDSTTTDRTPARLAGLHQGVTMKEERSARKEPPAADPVHLGSGAYVSAVPGGGATLTANHHDPRRASDVVYLDRFAVKELRRWLVDSQGEEAPFPWAGISETKLVDCYRREVGPLFLDDDQILYPRERARLIQAIEDKRAGGGEAYPAADFAELDTTEG